MLARSPAGILNVRYARSTSNLLVDFAAPASPRYWKLAYNTPEKSTGTETAAGGAAGLVVSGAGCCASNAAGSRRQETTGDTFIENPLRTVLITCDSGGKKLSRCKLSPVCHRSSHRT